MTQWSIMQQKNNRTSVCICNVHVTLSTLNTTLYSRHFTYLLCTSSFQQADNWRHRVTSNDGIINKHNTFVDYIWHHHSKFHIHCFATKWRLDKRSSDVAVLVKYFCIWEFRLHTHTHTDTHTDTHRYIQKSNVNIVHTTHTIISRPLHRSTCVSRHRQLKTGGFCWSNV